jgi:Fe-S cluster assembly iron-binding protein IscA
MALHVTSEAIEVLKRSLELSGIDLGRGGVRLRAARGLGGGADVQVELADAPEDGEEVVERNGVRLFVDRDLSRTMPDAVVEVEPRHDVVVVRPAGRRP